MLSDLIWYSLSSLFIGCIWFQVTLRKDSLDVIEEDYYTSLYNKSQAQFNTYAIYPVYVVPTFSFLVTVLVCLWFLSLVSPLCSVSLLMLYHEAGWLILSSCLMCWLLSWSMFWNILLPFLVILMIKIACFHFPSNVLDHEILLSSDCIYPPSPLSLSLSLCLSLCQFVSFSSFLISSPYLSSLFSSLCHREFFP